MANTLQVKIRFRNAKTRMKDHKEHVKEAIEFAQCNLWQRFRIKISDISFNDEYNRCNITLTCKERDIHEFYNIQRRLRGISAYLCKKYPEEYEHLKSGTRLFNYWVDGPVISIKEERGMSAYMCSPKILSVIADGVLEYAKDDDNLATVFEDHDDMVPKIIFEKLFRMNLDALEVRYGHETADSMYYKNDMKYMFDRISCSRMKGYCLYACLRKYLYQCAEGDIPNSMMYTVLNNLSDRVAHDIVQDSLAYDLMMNEISRW